jgi:hypothetical protein
VQLQVPGLLHGTHEENRMTTMSDHGEPVYWYRIMGESLPRGCGSVFPTLDKATRRVLDEKATNCRIYGYRTRQLARFGKLTDKLGEHGRVS